MLDTHFCPDCRASTHSTNQCNSNQTNLETTDLWERPRRVVAFLRLCTNFRDLQDPGPPPPHNVFTLWETHHFRPIHSRIVKERRNVTLKVKRMSDAFMSVNCIVPWLVLREERWVKGPGDWRRERSRVGWSGKRVGGAADWLGKSETAGVVVKYQSIVKMLNTVLNSFRVLSQIFFSLQESQKVPKLTINLGPKRPMEHAFFAVRNSSLQYNTIQYIILVFSVGIKTLSGWLINDTLREQN